MNYEEIKKIIQKVEKELQGQGKLPIIPKYNGVLRYRTPEEILRANNIRLENATGEQIMNVINQMNVPVVENFDLKAYLKDMPMEIKPIIYNRFKGLEELEKTYDKNKYALNYDTAENLILYTEQMKRILKTSKDVIENAYKKIVVPADLIRYISPEGTKQQIEPDRIPSEMPKDEEGIIKKIKQDVMQGDLEGMYGKDFTKVIAAIGLGAYDTLKYIYKNIGTPFATGLWQLGLKAMRLASLSVSPELVYLTALKKGDTPEEVAKKLNTHYMKYIIDDARQTATTISEFTTFPVQIIGGALSTAINTAINAAMVDIGMLKPTEIEKESQNVSHKIHSAFDWLAKNKKNLEPDFQDNIMSIFGLLSIPTILSNNVLDNYAEVLGFSKEDAQKSLLAETKATVSLLNQAVFVYTIMGGHSSLKKMNRKRPKEIEQPMEPKAEVKPVEPTVEAKPPETTTTEAKITEPQPTEAVKPPEKPEAPVEKVETTEPTTKTGTETKAVKEEQIEPTEPKVEPIAEAEKEIKITIKKRKGRKPKVKETETKEEVSAPEEKVKEKKERKEVRETLKRVEEESKKIKTEEDPTYEVNMQGLKDKPYISEKLKEIVDEIKDGKLEREEHILYAILSKYEKELKSSELYQFEKRLSDIVDKIPDGVEQTNALRDFLKSQSKEYYEEYEKIMNLVEARETMEKPADISSLMETAIIDAVNGNDAKLKVIDINEALSKVYDMDIYKTIDKRIVDEAIREKLSTEVKNAVYDYISKGETDINILREKIANIIDDMNKQIKEGKINIESEKLPNGEYSVPVGELEAKVKVDVPTLRYAVSKETKYPILKTQHLKMIWEHLSKNFEKIFNAWELIGKENKARYEELSKIEKERQLTKEELKEYTKIALLYDFYRNPEYLAITSRIINFLNEIGIAKKTEDDPFIIGAKNYQSKTERQSQRRLTEERSTEDIAKIMYFLGDEYKIIYGNISYNLSRFFTDIIGRVYKKNREVIRLTEDKIGEYIALFEKMIEDEAVKNNISVKELLETKYKDGRKDAINLLADRYGIILTKEALPEYYITFKEHDTLVRNVYKGIRTKYENELAKLNATLESNIIKQLKEKETNKGIKDFLKKATEERKKEKPKEQEKPKEETKKIKEQKKGEEKIPSSVKGILKKAEEYMGEKIKETEKPPEIPTKNMQEEITKVIDKHTKPHEQLKKLDLTPLHKEIKNTYNNLLNDIRDIFRTQKSGKKLTLAELSEYYVDRKEKGNIFAYIDTKDGWKTINNVEALTETGTKSIELKLIDYEKEMKFTKGTSKASESFSVVFVDTDYGDIIFLTLLDKKAMKEGRPLPKKGIDRFSKTLLEGEMVKTERPQPRHINPQALVSGLYEYMDIKPSYKYNLLRKYEATGLYIRNTLKIGAEKYYEKTIVSPDSPRVMLHEVGHAVYDSIYGRTKAYGKEFPLNVRFKDLGIKATYKEALTDFWKRMGYNDITIKRLFSALSKDGKSEPTQGEMFAELFSIYNIYGKTSGKVYDLMKKIEGKSEDVKTINRIIDDLSRIEGKKEIPEILKKESETKNPYKDNESVLFNTPTYTIFEEIRKTIQNMYAYLEDMGGGLSVLYNRIMSRFYSSNTFANKFAILGTKVKHLITNSTIKDAFSEYLQARRIKTMLEHYQKRFVEIYDIIKDQAPEMITAFENIYKTKLLEIPEEIYKKIADRLENEASIRIEQLNDLATEPFPELTVTGKVLSQQYKVEALSEFIKDPRLTKEAKQAIRELMDLEVYNPYGKLVYYTHHLPTVVPIDFSTEKLALKEFTIKEFMKRYGNLYDREECGFIIKAFEDAASELRKFHKSVIDEIKDYNIFAKEEKDMILNTEDYVTFTPELRGMYASEAMEHLNKMVKNTVAEIGHIPYALYEPLANSFDATIQNLHRLYVAAHCNELNYEAIKTYKEGIYNSLKDVEDNNIKVLKPRNPEDWVEYNKKPRVTYSFLKKWVRENYPELYEKNKIEAFEQAYKDVERQKEFEELSLTIKSIEDSYSKKELTNKELWETIDADKRLKELFEGIQRDDPKKAMGTARLRLRDMTPKKVMTKQLLGYLPETKQGDTILVKVNGKPVEYIVPKHIHETLTNTALMNEFIAKVASLQNFFKNIHVGYNIAFPLKNLPRDLWGFVRVAPVSIGSILTSVKGVKKLVNELKMHGHSDLPTVVSELSKYAIEKAKKRIEFEALPESIFKEPTSFDKRAILNELEVMAKETGDKKFVEILNHKNFDNPENLIHFIEAVIKGDLDKLSLEPPAVTMQAVNIITNVVSKYLKSVYKLNKFVELSVKYMAKEALEDYEMPLHMKTIIARNAGSPPFPLRGVYSSMMNSIWYFFNARTQSLYSKIWAIKNMPQEVIPKYLAYIALPATLNALYMQKAVNNENVRKLTQIAAFIEYMGSSAVYTDLFQKVLRQLPFCTYLTDKPTSLQIPLSYVKDNTGVKGVLTLKFPVDEDMVIAMNMMNEIFKSNNKITAVPKGVFKGVKRLVTEYAPQEMPVLQILSDLIDYLRMGYIVSPFGKHIPTKQQVYQGENPYQALKNILEVAAYILNRQGLGRFIYTIDEKDYDNQFLNTVKYFPIANVILNNFATISSEGLEQNFKIALDRLCKGMKGWDEYVKVTDERKENIEKLADKIRKGQLTENDKAEISSYINAIKKELNEDNVVIKAIKNYKMANPKDEDIKYILGYAILYEQGDIKKNNTNK